MNNARVVVDYRGGVHRLSCRRGGSGEGCDATENSGTNRIGGDDHSSGHWHLVAGPVRARWREQHNWTAGDRVLVFVVEANGHSMPIVCQASEASVDACIDELWRHTRDWLPVETAIAWTEHIWSTYWRSMP